MKKAQNKTSTPVTKTSTARILKVADCPSLSEKSTLIYHIGCNDKSDIQIRVYSNSSNGYFSNEWISLKSIQETIAKRPKDLPITSYLLHNLYRSKSINNPGFLFAVLKQEKLVVRLKENPRWYDTVDSKVFMGEVKALIDSDVSLNADDKPKKAAKKKVKAKAA